MGFIKDEGDGLFNARTEGTYTEDGVNYTLQLGVDGVADTNFILPSDAAWYITEVYDVNGVSGHIGLTVYSADVATLVSDIEALRQEAISIYTTFVITTTHYKTGNLVDRYKGSESAAHTLNCSDVAFTPPTVVWEITDTPLSEVCVTTGVFDQILLYNENNISTEFTA